MTHFASPEFWEEYAKLPDHIQKLADKNFERLKENAQHPSLHMKKVREFWSVRVGIGHRALAVQREDGLLWFWIGSHANYEAILKRL